MKNKTKSERGVQQRRENMGETSFPLLPLFWKQECNRTGGNTEMNG